MMVRKTVADADQIYKHLNWLGEYGARDAPSWQYAADTVPVFMGSLGFIGLNLPGAGFVLNCDGKKLGLKKVPPNVIERTWYLHFIDWLQMTPWGRARYAARSSRFAKINRFMLGGFGQRGAYTGGRDGIINARSNGRAYDPFISKVSLATPVANAWVSMFAVGGFPSAGTFTATPGAVLTRASAGAWSVEIPNTSGTEISLLLTLGYRASQQINAAIVIDTHVAVGGINVATAISQTINSTALTRTTGGESLRMTAEVTTAISATVHSSTWTYTNQANTGSRSTGAQSGASGGAIGRLTPTNTGPYITMQAGDYGVRSVQSHIVTVATPTTGVVALHIYKPMGVFFAVPAGPFADRDATINIDGVKEIPQASNVPGFLTALVLPNTTTTGDSQWFMRGVQVTA